MLLTIEQKYIHVSDFIKKFDMARYLPKHYNHSIKRTRANAQCSKVASGLESKNLLTISHVRKDRE